MYVVTQLPQPKVDGPPKVSRAGPLYRLFPNQAVLPQITSVRPKSVNHSYSHNAPFDRMKTRHKFALLRLWSESFIFSKKSNQHQSKIIRSGSGSFLVDAGLIVTGRRDADEVEAVGAKTWFCLRSPDWSSLSCNKTNCFVWIFICITKYVISTMGSIGSFN